MFHNREIRLAMLGGVLLTVLGTVLGFLIDWKSGLLVFCLCLLLLCGFWLFTAWRYREIKKLSRKLEQICSGDYSLDIRDNREGELSVLKNDIYKVTTRLQEQGTQSEVDKAALADALSDISHQMKTPLTSMMVMTELLGNEALDPQKRREFTSRLRTQLERMEWLLTSLLKLSKIDAGTAVFKEEPVSMAALVERVTEPLFIPMELKEQTLSVSGAEASFTGDFNWTVEAVTNILKNCMEHTPKGGAIQIEYGDNPLYTFLRIQDNGVGIAREDLPHIFQRFYKGKNASADSVGIGLAMSKSILQKQKGDVTVESTLGKGSVFTIKFYKQTV